MCFWLISDGDDTQGLLSAYVRIRWEVIFHRRSHEAGMMTELPGTYWPVSCRKMKGLWKER